MAYSRKNAVITDGDGGGLLSEGQIIQAVVNANQDALQVALVAGSSGGSSSTVTVSNPLPEAGVTSVVTAQPTVTAAGYATGNAVGNVMFLNPIMIAAGASAFLHEIHVFDKSNTKPCGDLLFFNISPTTGNYNATITDKTAFAYGNAGFIQIARFPIATSDWKTYNSQASADYGTVGRLLKSQASTGLWMAFVLDGTSNPTFVSTSDLQILLKFVPQAN